MSEKGENEAMLKDNVQETPGDANKLTLFDAICFVYSNIIGIGIFMSVSATFDVFASNSLAMVVIFWVIGSIMSIFGALCYAELGRRFPQSGGEIVYYKENLNEKFSVVFAIMYCFVIKTLTLAAISLTASKYIVNSFVTDTSKIELIRKLVAVSLLVVCYLVNCVSKAIAAKSGVLFMFLKSGLLLIIIVFGAIFMFKGDFSEWKDPFVLKEFNPMGLGLAFINIFWAFEGWSSLSLVAGDVQDANKNLPISIFVGVLCVAIMYTLTVISYCTVLGFNETRVAETIGISFAKIALKKAHLIIPILVFFSGLGSVNGTMYSTSETMKSASQKGMLPKVLGMVHVKSRMPVPALTIIVLLSLACMSFDFQKLLQYCAFVTWFFYFLSFCCLWIVKLKERGQANIQEGFSINYIFIVVIQCVCIFVISMCFYLSLIACIVIVGIMIFIYCIQYIPRDNTFFYKLNECDENVADFFKKFGFVDELTEKVKTKNPEC